MSTVVFEVNGGSGVRQEWDVRKGDVLQLPTSLFSRDGYYLTSWTCDSGTYLPGADYTVTGDVTFLAGWTELPDGRYHTNDESAPATVSGTYSYTPISGGNSSGEVWLVFLSAANEYGWAVEEKPDWMTVSWTNRDLVFSGNPDGPGVHMVSVRLNSAGDPFYIWWVVTVPSDSDSVGTVVFDTGGYGSVLSVSGRIGTAVELPGNTITRPGYVLAGWDIPVTEGTPMFALGSYFVIAGDYTASAHWLPEANVVILDGSGQIGNEIEAFVGYNQQTITLPSEGYSKEGHVFAGWRLTSSPDEIYALGYIYSIEGPTYMTAYYIPETADTCLVTYDSNGGVGGLSQIVQPGDSVVLPGREFSNTTDLVGWASSEDGEVYLPGDILPIQCDMTFTAVWGTEVPDIVTVRFDLNGGSGSASTLILSNGDLAQRPSDPVRSAYIFNGWYLVGGGEYDFSSPVTSSITLRADWVQHFTRTYSDGLVVITMQGVYSGLPTTVQWGDGTSSTGSLSFTHDYGGESAGTITVTTSVGIGGGTVSSTVQYSVSESSQGGGDGDDDDEGGGSGYEWIIILTVLLVVAVIAVWRLT